MKKYNETNFYNYKITQAPINKPITLQEAKDHLRVDGNDFDLQISQLIDTATSFCELHTGRTLINTTYKAFLDYLPYCKTEIFINRSILQSIISFQYYNNNVLTEIDNSLYYITESNEYSSIIFNSNSLIADNRKQAIVISFIAGYGADSSFVPSQLKSGLLSHVASLFENSGDCIDNSKNKQFINLYRQFKISNLIFSVV